MTPLRVVLDTNVIVSCLLFPGEMRSWLLPAWQAGHVRPLASRETTAELIRVLCYPKFNQGDPADALCVQPVESTRY